MSERYVTLINDFGTTFARRAEYAETVYYEIHDFPSDAGPDAIDAAIEAVDSAVSLDFERDQTKPPEATVTFEYTPDLGPWAGLADRRGDVQIAESGRGSQAVAVHELGHAVGLSHPGADPNGTRPNDWNVGGPLDGENVHSDGALTGPDSQNRLDGADTMMAWTNNRTEPGWLDTQALRLKYSAEEPEALVVPDGATVVADGTEALEVVSTAEAETVRVEDGATVSGPLGQDDEVVLAGELEEWALRQSGNVLWAYDDDRTAVEIAVNGEMTVTFTGDDGAASEATHGSFTADIERIDGEYEVTLAGEPVGPGFDTQDVA